MTIGEIKKKVEDYIELINRVMDSDMEMYDDCEEIINRAEVARGVLYNVLEWFGV